MVASLRIDIREGLIWTLLQHEGDIVLPVCDSSCLQRVTKVAPVDVRCAVLQEQLNHLRTVRDGSNLQWTGKIWFTRGLIVELTLELRSHLEVENVELHSQTQQVLDDFNLAVSDGDIHARVTF